jgi:hypothetical protein
MVKVLHTAAVLTVIVAVIPFGMTASSEAVGVWFKDQLPPVFQLALLEPFQVLVCPNVKLTKNKQKSNDIVVKLFEIDGSSSFQLVFFLFIFFRK